MLSSTKIDEDGYLPIGKNGADLLLKFFSQHHEGGSILLTSNRASKLWPETFDNDFTLTSALLDHLLHHAEAVIVIIGKSYRMKDQIDFKLQRAVASLSGECQPLLFMRF